MGTGKIWGTLLLDVLITAILFAGCLSSSFIRDNAYIPGEYEGSGTGFRGSIHVQVQVSEAGIDDIAITSHEESSYPGAAAMEELLEAVLEFGSTDLDAISGATFSSRGFLDAVDDALRKADAAGNDE